MFKKYLFTFLLIFSLFFFGLNTANCAASAYFGFDSDQKTVKLNSSFKVNIYIYPNEQQIDTARAEMRFDPDIINAELISLGSLLNNTSPGNYIDNENGVVSVGGFNVSGGITESGIFASITFKALKQGDSKLKFLDLSKIISNGQEKINFSQNKQTLITVVNELVPEDDYQEDQEKNIEDDIDEIIDLDELNRTLTVYSETHPDQERWYQDNDLIIGWDKLVNAEKYYYDLNNEPEFDPVTEFSSDLNEIKFFKLDDGIWYFHLKALFEDQIYSNKITYQIKIDTTAPKDFQPYFLFNEILQESHASLYFSTIDETSGIDYYQVQVDDDDWQFAEMPYNIIETEAGTFEYKVRVVDKAGNQTISSRPANLKVIFELQPDIDPFCIFALFGIESKFCCENVVLCILIILIILLILTIITYLIYRYMHHKKTKKRKRKPKARKRTKPKTTTKSKTKKKTKKSGKNMSMLMILLTFFGILSFCYVEAQIPQYIGYQGRLKDTGGNPMGGNYQFDFRIYDAAVAGNLVWSESQNLTVTDGYFSASLGVNTPLNLDFDQPYWLSTEVNLDGEMTPRARINSVGYSYTSDKTFSAETLGPAPIGSLGRIYYDTDDNTMYYYNGAWVSMSGATQLSELSDVNTSTPTNGNILMADGLDWDSVSQININQLGTVTVGVWNANSITDPFIDDNLTISGGTINNSIIGAVVPQTGNFTNVNLTGNLNIAGTWDINGTNVLVTANEINLLNGLTGTIWTSNNDGTGSGLDADTLDGIDSAGFLIAEADPVWTAAEPNYANLGQNEIITSNWVNTANPWSDNEVNALSSGAQGDILYHNGTSWTQLSAGVAGDFLQTQGAGANPVWAAAGGGAVPADSLDYTEFQDAMSLDASTSVGFGSNDYNLNLNGSGDLNIQDNGTDFFTINNNRSIDYTSTQSGADALDINLNSITTGTGIDITANNLTSGKALSVYSNNPGFNNTFNGLVDFRLANVNATGNLLYVGNSGDANGLSLWQFNPNPNSTKTGAAQFIYVTSDTRDGYGLYIDTEEADNTVRVLGIETSNTSGGQTAQTEHFYVRADGVTKVYASTTAAPFRSTDGEFGFYDSGGPNSRMRLYFRVNGTNRYINSSGTGDYSEYFKVDDKTLEFGEIVTVNKNLPNGITRTTTARDKNMIGVVSEFGTRNNDDEEDGMRHNDPNYENIGLIGQLPVLVNTENGVIEIGDYITSSSSPGVGMKADACDPTVGMALENYNDAGVGKVQIVLSRNNKSPNCNFEPVEQNVMVSNSTQAGRAVVSSGSLEQRIDFVNAFKDVPIVNLTPRDRLLTTVYWIENETENGFSIVLSDAVDADIEFNWQAVGATQEIEQKNSSEIFDLQPPTMPTNLLPAEAPTSPDQFSIISNKLSNLVIVFGSAGVLTLLLAVLLIAKQDKK